MYARPLDKSEVLCGPSPDHRSHVIEKIDFHFFHYFIFL